MTSPLYLVRLVLDRRSVLRVGARHRLGQLVDEGALLHAGLSQLFARSTEPAKVPLHTFALDDTRALSIRRPDLLFLLAYADMNAAELTGTMGPTRSELLVQCEAREMPAFEMGQRLGFRTRVCPIVRTRKPGSRAPDSESRGGVKHRELDAFVHATLAVSGDSVVGREEIYRRWLRTQAEGGGACALEHATLTSFQREVMRRGGNARIERPNAVLEGALAVADPVAFRRLLARGIGRHRAYGFGMLLLRPVVR